MNLKSLQSMSVRVLRKRYLPHGLTRSVTVLAGVLVLPFVAFTGSASAYACGSNRICLYEHIQSGGAQIDYYLPVLHQCYNLPSNWNDRASSIHNNTSGSVTFFTDQSCNGFADTMVAYQYIGSLGWDNDEITSFCRGGC